MRGTVIAVASLVLLVGCGPARQSGAPASEAPVIASIDPNDVTTKIVGATPKQETILREVLAGLGPSLLEEVEIRPAPRKPQAVSLVVPHDVENAMVEWHSGLLVQGFAERSRELGLPTVAYYSADREDPLGESFGPVSADPPSRTLSDAMRTARTLRQVAEQHGAEVRRIEILKPNGYAFLVDLRVEGDQARFLRDGLPRVLQLVDPDSSGFEGDYSLIVDGDGKRVWEGERAKDGDGGWSEMGGTERRELAGCSPFFVGGPPRRGPPPCPADSAPQERAPARTRIVGATPKQETILREILTGLGQTALAQIRVSPADADWTPSEPHSVVLHIDYSSEDEHGRASWEADLLAQAFDRRSRELHLQAVAGYETPDDGTGLQSPAEPARLERKPITAEELTSMAKAAAKASGAELVDLRVVRPQHLAVAITLSTDHPAEYLKNHLLTFLDAMPSPSDHEYDGLYVLVVDGKGKFVWLSAQTVSDNLSGGSGGARHDLDGCDPVRGSRPVDYSPPPCPAGDDRAD
jgi:hypothetical protein